MRAVIKIGRPGWAVGAAFCASSIGMVVALTKTSVAVVLVIFALSPLAAAVMAWILIGERVRNYTWVAIASRLPASRSWCRDRAPAARRRAH